MNARPQIREILIEKRIRRWCNIARFPLIAPKCSPSPEIMRKLQLSEVSVYE